MLDNSTTRDRSVGLICSLSLVMIILGGISEPIVLRGQFGVKEHDLLPQNGGCLLGRVSHLPPS